MALYRSPTGALFYLEGDPDPTLVRAELVRLSAQEEAELLNRAPPPIEEDEVA